jgi:hypothetical protein
MPADNKTSEKSFKRKKLFPKESLLFRIILALINSQLPLRFYAASFACILAP